MGMYFAWLLPAGHPYTTELTNLRPDLVFISGLPSNDVKGKSDAENRATVERLAKRITIHIVEVGYCADTAHAEKDEVKVEQHARLVRVLTGQPIGQPTGQPIPNLHTHFAQGRFIYHPPFTLGRTGSLPASLPDTLKKHLGMGPAAVKECTTQLTRHAVHYVERFYKNRYATLGTMHGPPRPPPPRKPG